ncbi:MAG: hypothetical protein ACRCVW_01600 [Brevinema sp.]
MVQKKEMKKQNWVITISGIALTILGYLLVAPITRDYETPRAFFAILILNLGLLTIILGLALPFEHVKQK